jgi:hypothetical protein
MLAPPIMTHAIAPQTIGGGGSSGIVTPTQNHTSVIIKAMSAGRYSTYINVLFIFSPLCDPLMYICQGTYVKL